MYIKEDTEIPAWARTSGFPTVTLTAWLPKFSGKGICSDAQVSEESQSSRRLPSRDRNKAMTAVSLFETPLVFILNT